MGTCFVSYTQAPRWIGETHLEVALLNIDKSCLFHCLSLNLILDNRERTTYLLTAFNKELAPLMHRTLLVNAPIITVHP